MSFAFQLDGVSFQYSGKESFQILVQNLEVECGKKVFIYGPSGSGKSILLSLLSGILLPQKGSLKALNQCLSSLSAGKRDEFRADHIGYVFQLFNLIPYLSVSENIALPTKVSERRKNQCLRNGGSVEAQIENLMARLKLDPKNLRDRRASELSIGQQQRVAAARALIGSPEIIIADEPTSALDEGSQMAFLELLFQECESSKSTLLFVSHDTRLKSGFDESIDLQNFQQGPAS